MGKRVIGGAVAIGCALASVIPSGKAAWAAHSSLPQAQQVITYVNGQVLQTSTRFNRLVVIGQDENARPPVAANTAYAIIATDHPHLVARNVVNGIIDNVGIDDERGIAYLSVGSYPFKTSLNSPSYHEDLWAINLKSGRLLWHRMFYQGEAEVVGAMGVDSGTGHVFVASSRQGSQTYDLTMINPSDMSLHVETLLGTPDHVYVNSKAHRVAVSTVVGQTGATTSRFEGYDTRTLRHVWSHPFTYVAAAYATFATFFDNRTQQAWALAPGGLVTQVDVASGRITRQVQMMFNHPDNWHLNGFAVNTRTEQAYATWDGDWKEHGDSTCHVDSVNPASGHHTPLFDYSFNKTPDDSFPCGAANATLTQVDEANNRIVTADGKAIHVFDARTHKQVKSVNLVGKDGTTSTWVASTAIQRPHGVSVVFISDVPYQNQGTGAVIAGAATFVNL